MTDSIPIQMLKRNCWLQERYSRCRVQAQLLTTNRPSLPWTALTHEPSVFWDATHYVNALWWRRNNRKVGIIIWTAWFCFRALASMVQVHCGSAWIEEPHLTCRILTIPTTIKLLLCLSDIWSDITLDTVPGLSPHPYNTQPRISI